MENIILIKDLCFGYSSNHQVLKKVSLNIEKGKFTIIVGENGSGKSTLLKCIVGLNKNYTGKIVLNEKIGYLPQKTDVQTDFPASIEEVVLSGRISNSLKSIFYTSNDREVASSVMKSLNIYDIRKKSFADLSGGQQQRVLIARTLCASDKLIVLDEMANGLDPSIAKQLYSMLDNYKKKNNLTIVMVSHDVERAIKYADNVIEITNGKVSYNGSKEDYTYGGAKK